MISTSEKCKMEFDLLTDIPVEVSTSRNLAARKAHLSCMSSTSGCSCSLQLTRLPWETGSGIPPKAMTCSREALLGERPPARPPTAAPLPVATGVGEQHGDDSRGLSKGDPPATGTWETLARCSGE